MIKKIINWAAVILFCFVFLASISQSPEPDYLPASVILIGAILWAAIQGILWLYKTVDRKSILIGIILVGLSIRLVWAIFVPSLPVSDFLTYHNAALQLSENTPVTQKNMGYIVLLSLGYRLFPNILTGKIINVIFSTISIILVYSIGKKLIDQKIGLIAATLLAVFPSEIMMVGVLGTEISTTTLYLAIVRCLLEIDNKKTEKQRILWAILTGLFLGLGYTIRSSTIFYLPGILLWILLIKDIKFSRKAIYLGTLILGMVVGLSIIASQLSIISGEFSLTSLNAQDMYPLLSGTNFTSSGQYNQEDVLLYNSWPEDNKDDLAIQTAINRITSSPQRFSLLVLRKWSRMMGTNDYGIYWAIGTIDWGSGNIEGIFATDTAPWDRSWEDSLPSKEYLFMICRLLLQTPYILVWFFALPALKNFGENKLGPIVFAIVLLTLLPHTVLEVQGRYHHYMMPFIILLASFGYTHFLDHGIKKSEV